MLLSLFLRRSFLAHLIFLLIFFAAPAYVAANESADLIVYGKIYTADSEDRIVQAFAVKDGLFIYAGDKKGAEKLINAKTKIIELKSGLVTAGIIDGHTHGHEGGVADLFEVNLQQGKNLEEYLELVAQFTKAHPTATHITGAGWQNSAFGPEGPKAADLDKIAPNIPVVIHSNDRHSIWVNSKALEIAKITSQTADVEGGVIERDKNANPTGTFRENSRILVKNVIPPYTVQQYKEAITAYQNRVKVYGVTSYWEPMVNEVPKLLAAYNEMDAEGSLQMKVYAGWKVTQGDNPLTELDKAAEAMEKSRGGDFEVNAVKLFIDGVVEGKTAFLIDAYKFDPNFFGEALWNEEMLKKVVAKADRLGLIVHSHCVGDAATRMILNAYEYAAELNKTQGARHAITHLQLVAPEDIERMANLGVVAVINSYWFTKHPNYFEELEVPYLGEKRANKTYPLRTFFDKGLIVSLASDYPVTTLPIPMDGIQKGVSRTDLKGDSATLLNPAERATLVQMLRAATINGAYQNKAENKIGSIEVGKQADFIILDQDLFTIDTQKIIRTQILETIVKGKSIYQREN